MMLMKIFFSRRHSPTNVTLRFVNIQNHSCLYSKSRTDLSEAFGDVFMYRRLTNSILFCRLTHRCIIVYDISCNFHCPFLDITFHENSPHSLLFYNLCREFLMYVCIILANDYLPQHFLYFLPEPQGQGSFLPIFGSVPTYGVCISSPFI